jgi:uncharacterized protein
MGAHVGRTTPQLIAPAASDLFRSRGVARGAEFPTMTEVPARCPFIEVTGFRFRLWPILLAAVLMEGVLIAGREVARYLLKSGPKGLYVGWTFMAAALLFQAMFGYLCILLMRRLLPEADDHLRWPPKRSYAGLALLIGVAIAIKRPSG